MSTDRWRMVKGLFQRALTLPPSEWEEYLDRVSAGDADLRGRVAELLAEHRDTSGVLASHATGARTPAKATAALRAPVAAAGLAVGEVVDGTYALEVCLGESPRSTTWKARHTGIGDVVTLKIASSSREWSSWLDLQSRSARLSRSIGHPALARVYDIRSTDQGPYVIREFVEGRTLDDMVVARGGLSMAEALGVLQPTASLYDAAAMAGGSLSLRPRSIIVCRSDAPPVSKVLSVVIADEPGGEAGTAARIRRFCELLRFATTGDTFLDTAEIGGIAASDHVEDLLARSAEFESLAAYTAMLRESCES